MFSHLSLPKLERLLRRHWPVVLCVAALAGILWIGAPAWAAPVTRPANQTVPDPTATPEGNPVATATPQPDDDDDDDDNTGNQGSSGPGVSTDPNAPNIVLPLETASSPATEQTAQVTVDGLNVREGPGTDFNPLGTLPAETQVTVVSRSEDGAWWYICCLPGTETRGWVSAQLLVPDFDRAQAETLVPLFGAEPVTVAAATPTPATVSEAQPQAELPLEVDFMLTPYFVWQGITATLSITVNNPNAVDAINVLLSDELPTSLALVETQADAGGTVESVTTAEGRTLLLFRWASIPADTAVSATIVTLVSAELTDGAVIDNLVATRADNVGYSTDAVTIGMPPLIPPIFQ